MANILKLDKLLKPLSSFRGFNLNCTPLPETVTEVDAISGAFMLTSKTVLKKAGMFDENYFLHCEDLDICMKIKASGSRVVFDPKATIVHFRGGCSQNRDLTVLWHKHAGMNRFYNIHFRARYPHILMYLIKCAIWTRFSLTCIKPVVRLLLNNLVFRLKMRRPERKLLDVKSNPNPIH